MSHLSAMGQLFTLGFTYSGFALLTVRSLSEKVIYSMVKINDNNRRERCGMQAYWPSWHENGRPCECELVGKREEDGGTGGVVKNLLLFFGVSTE